ncbi:uncharacterized protein PHACADRAFT_203038 [Phanerochaete carnosa HHB-10118-sp]|uniref:Uncharacterized protein n=1 Tax=Phanerochaete carnosa (strain HHB-10118-sp) TaxID=650164 RepID=K5VB06_PHACS|nr:uncharacterized protein PHACADRAFT_203038 [Phanerochaete carnosa HHB-10118-sp]EKM48258.1 hypothetical protein PHACADRAFT_203038 [Phanerochaete carnosa HHB-10118-sp]
MYGVTGGARMPTLSGKWAAGWEAVGRDSVDMLGLSREVFMKRCILEQLNNVNGNAMTTTVAKNVDVVDDIWEVDLTTWYLYPTRRAVQCRCDQECRQYTAGSHRFEGWQSRGGLVKAKLRQVEHSAELSYRSLKRSVMIRCK